MQNNTTVFENYNLTPLRICMSFLPCCDPLRKKQTLQSIISSQIYTHYHNSNLLWRTVSRRVNEVIPSDHPRRVASRVIRWYGLIHET